MTMSMTDAWEGDGAEALSVSRGELRRLLGPHETADGLLARVRTCHVVTGDGGNHAPHCDLCGGTVYELMPRYCPRCGAMVTGEIGDCDD
ncbi:hypothetical protein [Olsenella profusa]|uniref:Uncharacterized protein n=1 Tax=Olsenella profusa F0195 TaxID=1125712 RepID=U2T4R9_9ACTN|nr:hypothetical protein [Olsenella profusa]ERL08054.1 hypothetical protein HMPREF1316_2384 [Olsenella profusa F0195]